MTTSTVPFHRTYWVLPGKLLAGYCPGSKDPKEATEKLTALIRDLRKDCEDSSRESPEMMEQRKMVVESGHECTYKITYPNGMIYIRHDRKPPPPLKRETNSGGL
jgi:hypothetical protein